MATFHVNTHVRKLRTTSSAMALLLALPLSSCAWVLHPERRGQPPNGTIDTIPLIIDIVWFLPGLIPGVVCLAVDFASGAIYTSGSGATRLAVRPDGEILVRRPPIDEPTPARVALVDIHGTVLAQASSVWAPEHSRREDTLRLDLGSVASLAQRPLGPLFVELRLADAAPERFELDIGVR